MVKIIYPINDKTSLNTISKRWELDENEALSILRESGFKFYFPFALYEVNSENDYIGKNGEGEMCWDVLNGEPRENVQINAYPANPLPKPDTPRFSIWTDIDIDSNERIVFATSDSCRDLFGVDTLIVDSSKIIVSGVDLKEYEQRHLGIDHQLDLIKPKLDKNLTSDNEAPSKTALKVIGLLMHHLNSGKYSNNGKPNKSQIKELLLELAKEHKIDSYGLRKADERILNDAFLYMNEQKED